MKKITHCICMVTYNHEEYIREALDSIFDNELLPDKVLLFDDCSTDNTWNIVSEYSSKYPDILISSRNEHNLGIYANINKMYKAAAHSDCDIISLLAGDDFLEKGILEKINDFIIKENINYKTGKFMFLPNFKELHADGSIRFKYNYKYRNRRDQLYLMIAGKVYNRCIGFSKELATNFASLKSNFGLWADFIWAVDFYRKCDKFYYLNTTGAWYRAGIGTVSRETTDSLFCSRIASLEYVENSFPLNMPCKLFIRRDIFYHKTLLNRNLYNKAHLLLYVILNITDFHINYLIPLCPSKLKKFVKKNLLSLLFPK